MTSPEVLAQALDEALAALAAGETTVAVLARRPDLAAELRPLLAAAQAASDGRPAGSVPRQAQAASRAQFLAQASRLRGAAVALPAARRPARWLGLARAAWLGVLLVAGFAAIGYTAVAASAESLPGDPLYPIKRAAEDTQLLLTTDSAAHERLEDGLDQRRAQEVEALSDQGRMATVDFTGRLEVLPEDGSGLWVVGGVPVRLAPDAQVDGNPELGDRLRVIGILQTNRTVLAQAVFVLRSAQRTPTPAPSASATGTMAAPASATATPSITPSATASRTSPPPTATLEPTDDHGGEIESETPAATEDHGGGGPSPSNTPQPTNGGGGGPGPSPSNTPQPTNGGGGGPGPSPSNTPRATDDDNGGPSPSNTPEETDEPDGDNDHGGGSASETPEPDVDGGGGGGSGGGGGGGGGPGPSPSNTPKPDEGD